MGHSIARCLLRQSPLREPLQTVSVAKNANRPHRVDRKHHKQKKRKRLNSSINRIETSHLPDNLEEGLFARWAVREGKWAEIVTTQHDPETHSPTTLTNQTEHDRTFHTQKQNKNKWNFSLLPRTHVANARVRRFAHLNWDRLTLTCVTCVGI